MSHPRPRLGQTDLGYGIGLRKQHFDAVNAATDQIDFLEILSENFMGFGGRPQQALREVAERYPLVLHGVSLSIGTVSGLDPDYLTSLYALIGEIKPRWFSDHLCFSSAFGVDYHDLIPLPFTEEALTLVTERIKRLQGEAGIPFLIENPSYYIAYGDSTMSEAEFLTRLVEGADCGLLLDVNNIYVNAHNHGYDAHAFVDALPLSRVVQLHMAGHLVLPDVIIDTHGADVPPSVVDLFQHVMTQTGPVSTVLERDHNVPDLPAMIDELGLLRRAGEAAAREYALADAGGA